MAKKIRIVRFTISDAKRILPKRKSSDNKASAGRSLIIAGSQGMYGAAVLAAEAAARIGSGYVNLFTKQSAFLSIKHPSFLVIDSRAKKIPFERASAIAIGPGLGTTSTAVQLLRQLLKKTPKNVVIDADALNILAEKKFWSLPADWIVTPHEGELSRLLGISSKKIRDDRRAAVVAAQKKLGCIVILKGHRTLVAADKIYEIQSGNAALAKAGTGDVLTGLITGLLAQGLKNTEAACLGVFVHGWLGDLWIKEGNDELSLLPEDLLKRLPQALSRIRKSRSRK